MPTIVGGYGAEKDAEDSVTDTFTSPEVLALIAARTGEAVMSLVIKSFKTQVVRGDGEILWRAGWSAPHRHAATIYRQNEFGVCG